ncbi:MAG TPA: Hsp20/alpha crystallin family protein [Roseiflexaceae bacterium]|nr:Hsp20/alpha crystallin family protein [Roseiflexaceae bacterium]
MTELTRWDPFQEMTTLRDAMNQLLTESFVRPRGWAGAGQVPLDLYETEQEYVAKLAVPGLRPDNFEITAQQNVLTIKGHTQTEPQEGVRYHVREHRFGDFSRTIQFPTAVETERIKANLADGILTIRVPKAEAARPKRITVKAG